MRDHRTPIEHEPGGKLAGFFLKETQKGLICKFSFQREQLERPDGREKEGTSGQVICGIPKNLWCAFKTQAHKHTSTLGLVRLWPQNWR